MKKLGLLTIVSFVFVSAAVAQTAPIRGTVVLKKADGSAAPVTGALVELLRMDLTVKPQSTKTNSVGAFTFVGIPIAGVYVLVVSAPGAKAEIIPNIGAGMEGLSIALSTGDGRVPAETEVRKKAQAYQKQVREVTDTNRRIEEVNAIYRSAIEKGNGAIQAKNFDLAIAEYDNALNADPTHPGAPVLLTNKATAIRLRGSEKFNNGIRTRNDTLTEAAKKDFQLAFEAASKAVRMIEATDPPTVPAELRTYRINLLKALTAWAESSRLVATKSDPAKEGEMRTAFEKLLKAESDPTIRWHLNLVYARSLSELAGMTGDYSAAETEYKKLLAQNSNEPDLLFDAGFVLCNMGIFNSDAARLQEAANYLQRFLEIAPAGHAKRADATALLDDLKSSHKIAPKRVM